MSSGSDALILDFTRCPIQLKRNLIAKWNCVIDNIIAKLFCRYSDMTTEASTRTSIPAATTCIKSWHRDSPPPVT